MASGQDYSDLFFDVLTPVPIKDMQTLKKIGDAAGKARKKPNEAAEEALSIFKKPWFERQEKATKKFSAEVKKRAKIKPRWPPIEFDKYYEKIVTAKKAMDNGRGKQKDVEKARDELYLYLALYIRNTSGAVQRLETQQAACKQRIKDWVQVKDTFTALKGDFEKLMIVAPSPFNTEFGIYMLHTRQLAINSNGVVSNYRALLKTLKNDAKAGKSEITYAEDYAKHVKTKNFLDNVTY